MPGNTIDVNLNVGSVPSPELSVILVKLDAILKLLATISTKEDYMKQDIVSLTAQVAQNTTVEGSAITLINGIAAQLANAIAANDPAALDALQAQLASSATALAAAVTANTPVATSTTAPPPVTPPASRR